MPTSVPTTARFAATHCESLLRDVNLQIARTARGAGEDEVHDLRVLIRRVRQVLSVLRRCFGPNEAQQIRRNLKAIMVQAGNVRDLDMAMRLLRKDTVHCDPRILQGIMVEFRERRKTAARALQVSLNQWERRGVRDLLHHDGADARFCSAPADVIARRILKDLAKEHFKRGKDALKPSATDEELHRFRIAGKEFRYTSDFFAPLFQAKAHGELFDELRERLKDLQGLLGEIHDCSIVRHMVSALSMASESQGHENLLAALKEKQRSKIRKFRKKYADEFSTDATQRRWRKSLRLL